MSRPTIPQMQRAHAKKMAKVWTSFVPITITDRMREDNPVLEKCHSMHGNSFFEVHCFACPSEIGGFMQVTVRRHADLEDITWEQLQRVKNELFGQGHTALELYPPKDQEWHPKVNVRILYICPVGWPVPFGLGLPTAWGQSDG
jgi:hypothetical protein